MADEVVASPTPVATETPVAPVADTVITPADLDSNKFSSDQIMSAIENMKAGKVHKEAPKEVVSDNTQKGLPTETPVSEPVQKSTVTETPIPEFKAPEVPFEQRVAEQVEKILKSKEPVAPKEPDFTGYKTQEELNEAFEKDPTGTFDKVVALKVKQGIEAVKAELQKGINESLAPVKAEAESKQRSNHLETAKLEVKELADPNFAKLVASKLGDAKNSVLFDDMIKNGKNPYVEMAKIVRGENVSNYEKQAYERGVKETEARLSKASRAVVEGGGKVTVETEGIDLENASSAQILQELKRHGKA
jgi:hypothetical protein